MSDWSDVRRLALGLPGAEERSDQFRVGGKLFAWIYPERVDPKKPRIPNPDVLCVHVGGADEKQALLSSSGAFFTTEHYDGYPIVLVRLPMLASDELRELIVDAWRARAPKRLLADFDG